MISGPSSALVEPDLEFEDLPLRQARRRPDFVVRLGPKAFELSAGFLRIRDGDDPLDASGVHPEAYPVVRRILAATKSQLDSLIRNTPVLRQLEPDAFTDTVFGVPTVTAILRELEKPGRDPRPAYKTANSCEGVEKLEDLKPGMVLEGVVTNVAAFGGFVDVGVHQDGLVHISAMANAYVKDPRKIAKPGDVVRVKVLEVDPKRRRISLTMRLDQALEARPSTARCCERWSPQDRDWAETWILRTCAKPALRSGAKRSPGTGNTGASTVGDLCSGDNRQATCGIIPEGVKQPVGVTAVSSCQIAASAAEAERHREHRLDERGHRPETTSKRFIAARVADAANDVLAAKRPPQRSDQTSPRRCPAPSPDSRRAQPQTH
jgi:predicted RNA-binding protein with RPS1 domain